MPDFIRQPEKQASLIHLDSGLRRNGDTMKPIIINSKQLRELKTVEILPEN